jgi:Fe2+ transport system protein FeoA
MNGDVITCPLCGTAFALENQAACASCPLHANCAMVCCPTCGYTIVAPERSQLARAAVRWLRLLRRRPPQPTRHDPPAQQTLADAPLDVDVRIVACSALGQDQLAWLQAYGVEPGQCVRVRQHRPVTIVQVERAELAFERAIAQAVQIELIASVSAETPPTRVS